MSKLIQATSIFIFMTFCFQTIEAQVSIFDGKTFKGWKEYNASTIGPKWSIVDGMLVASADGVEKNTGFGHSLITKKKYGNFELTLEYKICKGGNSGIMYHVVEDSMYSQDYVTGPEYQLIDDEFTKDESLPNRMAGALYDMYTPAANKKLNGHDQWNSVKLIYNKGHVEHWLNGIKVVEYEEFDADWDKRVAQSKWKDSKVWGMSKEGHIGLQDHGYPIYFKNIKVKEL